MSKVQCKFQFLNKLVNVKFGFYLLLIQLCILHNYKFKKNIVKSKTEIKINNLNKF